MQGHLHEIDIRSILQLVEMGQRTGELFVETYSIPGNGIWKESYPNKRWQTLPKASPKQAWFVFFLNGQIIHATQAESGTGRLQDYLQRDIEPETFVLPPSPTLHSPEYGYLWALLENGILTPAQARKLIRSLTVETLFDLLSLHQGAFIFEQGSPLSPQLTTLEISPMVSKIMQQIQEWKQFYPLIQSPDQLLAMVSDRPLAIAEYSVLDPSLPEDISPVLQLLKNKTHSPLSIRRLARQLNQDILSLTRTLYPYLQKGILHTVASETPRSSSLIADESEVQYRPPRVVCIDDSGTVRKTIETSLSQQGYEVTSIGNSLKAISLLFQLKPDLILCDIAMPEPDGYELCAMLRQSTAFRYLPIVMLTGKANFVDRVRARLVGATDYLTKPFGDQELLMLVEKYVGPGNIDFHRLESLLADDLLEELGSA